MDKEICSQSIKVLNDFIVKSLLLCNEELLVRSLKSIKSIKADNTDANESVNEDDKLMELVIDMIKINKDIKAAGDKSTEYYKKIEEDKGTIKVMLDMNTKLEKFVPEMLDKYPEICTEELLAVANSVDFINRIFPFIKKMIEDRLSK